MHAENSNPSKQIVYEYFEKLSEVYLPMILDAIRYDIFHYINPKANARELFERNLDKHSFLCLMYDDFLFESDFKKFVSVFNSFVSLIDRLKRINKKAGRTLIVCYLDYKQHDFLRKRLFFEKEVVVDYYTGKCNSQKRYIF